MNKKFNFLLVAALATISMTAFAQEKPAEPEFKPSGKTEGLIFTNWHTDLTEKATQTNAFDVTRVYFGYKYAFSEKISGRILLDAERSNDISSAVADTTTGKVTFSKTTGALTPFVKYAYLQIENILPKTTLELGMHGTRMFKVQEDFFGYRYIAKELADEKKFSSSADLGATATIKPIDKLKVSLFALQGEGFKKPQDAFGKNKYGVALEITPIKSITLVAYADNMAVDTIENQSTYAVFAGYKHEKFRLAYGYDFQKNVAGKKDNNLSGMSVYGAASVTKKAELFARFSELSSNNNFNGAADGKIYIAGLQYSLIKGVKTALNYQGFQSAATGAVRNHMVYLNFELRF